MKRMAIGFAIISLVFVFAWQIGNALLTVSVVLPPQATLQQKARLILSGRNYSVAAPHQSVLHYMRFSLVAGELLFRP